MKDLEIQGDLRDEYLAIQEAEASTQEPDLASDEEIRDLLQEMWEEMKAPQPKDTYIEEDAFRDFIEDQYEEFN